MALTEFIGNVLEFPGNCEKISQININIEPIRITEGIRIE